MPPGIYVIENVINGKRYVGQTINVEKRMWDNHYNCKIIHRAIKKYNKDTFKRYIIIYCEERELNRLEIECIKLFHSHVSENGYNISWGGDSPMRGRNHSEESNKKNRDAHLGKHAWNLGIPWDDEIIKKFSESHTGLHHSDATREKMSKTRNGGNIWNFGKHPSEETNRKNRESHLGKNNPRYGTKLLNRTSQYYGVTKKTDKRCPKYIRWFSRIVENEKVIRLGTYKMEEDAARAYDKYVFENNLDRPLNFPEEYNKKEVDL